MNKKMSLLLIIQMVAPYLMASAAGAALIHYTRYSDKTTALSFSYPDGAKVERQPDNDTLVRISGEHPAGHMFIISLNKTVVQAGTTPEAFLRFFREHAFGDWKEVNLLSQERRYMGTRSQFSAMVDTFRLSNDKDHLCQKIAVFPDPQAGGQLRLMTITGSERDVSNLDALFCDISLSLDHDTTADVSRSAARVATYTVDGISFQYPEAWTVAENPDRDTLVKINGPNIDLHMGSVPTALNVSMDQMQRILEDDYTSKLPRAKKLSDVSTTYGGRLSGQQQTFTFEMQGHPCYGEMFLFQHGNKLYCLSLSCWGMDQVAAQKQFGNILSSLNAH